MNNPPASYTRSSTSTGSSVSELSFPEANNNEDSDLSRVGTLERELATTLGPFMDRLRALYPQFHDDTLRFALESVDYRQDDAVEMLQGLASASLSQLTVAPGRSGSPTDTSTVSSITLSDTWSMVETEDQVPATSSPRENEHQETGNNELNAENQPTRSAAPPLTPPPPPTPPPPSPPPQVEQVVPQDVVPENEVAIGLLQSVFPHAGRDLVLNVLEAACFNTEDAADILAQIDIDAPMEDESAPQNPSTTSAMEVDPQSSQEAEGMDDWAVLPNDDHEVDVARPEVPTPLASFVPIVPSSLATDDSPSSEDPTLAHAQLRRLQDVFPSFPVKYLCTALACCDYDFETTCTKLFLVKDSEAADESSIRADVTPLEFEKELERLITDQGRTFNNYAPTPRWNSQFGWTDARTAQTVADSEPEEASFASREYSARLKHPTSSPSGNYVPEDFERGTRPFSSLLSQLNPLVSAHASASTSGGGAQAASGSSFAAAFVNDAASGASVANYVNSSATDPPSYTIIPPSASRASPRPSRHRPIDHSWYD